MSTTVYQHRFLILAPSAKATPIASWLNTNIDPNFCSASLGAGLNASGLSTDPVTHNWVSAAFRDHELKPLLLRLCTLTGVAPPTPAQWSSWTRAQKISWLQSVQANMRTNYGIWVSLRGNDDVWDDPSAALAVMSLKTIGP